MRRFYSLLITFLLPFIALRFLWRSIKSPNYRYRLKERFGLNINELTKVDIIIHAVSLGEVKAIIPLANALIKKQKKILITTTTPTGSDEVKRALGDLVSHCYLPIDSPYCLKAWLKKTGAKQLILIEKELWPNLVYFAKAANMDVFMVNAMLSARSYARLKRFHRLFKPTLHLLTAVFSQNDTVSDYYKGLGVKKVITLGNLKFDVSLDEIVKKQGQTLKPYFAGKKVLIAASTHPGEEAVILDVFKNLSRVFPDLILLLAPRHPERFNEVENLLDDKNLNYQLSNSGLEALNNDVSVLLINELGVLMPYFLVADIAFVAGSFVPVGGHNPLEPILTKTCVISGPLYANWQGIYEDLNKAGAVSIVADKAALLAKIEVLFNEPALMDKQISHADTFMKQNQGALNQLLNHLE